MFWCPYLLLLHTNLQVDDAWIKWWPSSFINGRSTSEILKRRRKKRRNCKRWSIKMSMCSTFGMYSLCYFCVFVYQEFVWCPTHNCDGKIGRTFWLLKWGVVCNICRSNSAAKRGNIVMSLGSWWMSTRQQEFWLQRLCGVIISWRSLSSLRFALIPLHYMFCSVATSDNGWNLEYI